MRFNKKTVALAEDGAEFRRSRWWRPDPELMIAVGVICAAVVVGLATVGDYGITVDEWNADDYGQKALAWYSSGFTDRAMFTDVEPTLWYYGPWFHMLTAAVQSWDIAEHWAVRHAMTFLVGLAGVALTFPMARLAAGRWAGLAAVVLCLGAGYLYGSLFFTPIDVPFLFAMLAATLAVMLMANRRVPTWPATVAAGLLTGLAIATRSSGFITQAYLVGAMVLCALEVAFAERGARAADLRRIGLRTLAALAIGWVFAFCLWPWVQIGNPVTQFVEAFRFFAKHPASWEIPYWGETVTTNHLPRSYVPGELLARLPIGFLILLAIGLTLGFCGGIARLIGACRSFGDKRGASALAPLVARRSRQMLIVWAATLLPIVFVILEGSTLYNGLRHVLFLIPMLAVIAGDGFARLLPWLRRIPLLSGVGIGGYLGYQLYLLAALHPLEYIEFNPLAGGVHGAYQRFEMDYWSAAATLALRRLEDRLALQDGESANAPPPRLLICIPWRESMVAPMYRRPWRLETDPAKADYIIATESNPDCADGQPVVPIDEVKRFGRVFAWTYARRPAQAPPAPAQAAPSASADPAR